MAELNDLKQRLRDFAAARDWEQFHTPKNLAMALVAETAEGVEHFQWLTTAESQTLDPARRVEIALDIDLADVAHRKIDLNEKRFPPSIIP